MVELRTQSAPDQYPPQDELCQHFNYLSHLQHLFSTTPGEVLTLHRVIYDGACYETYILYKPSDQTGTIAPDREGLDSILVQDRIYISLTNLQNEQNQILALCRTSFPTSPELHASPVYDLIFVSPDEETENEGVTKSEAREILTILSAIQMLNSVSF